jgi:hypothetical protein
MSDIDTRYSGGGRGYAHEQLHDRVRPVHQRILPFLGLLTVAVLGLPILETISWGIGRWDPATGTLIKWGWVITGLALGLIALGIGLKVSRRLPFVVWHVVITCVLAGLAAGITTDIGWAYSRFWTVLHAFGSLLIAASWGLYRIDALRAMATGKSDNGWADVIGLAKSRPRKVRTDEAHVYVEVEHGPGDTTETVKAAAKKLESAAGAISGTTVVVPGERADTSSLTLTMADPFAGWRKWPGLSHPGGSFAHPLRTAYYSTGKDQWFSFVRSLPSPMTSFVSPGATFVGAAGTTGSGKSGFLTNAAAETLSRTDAVVVWGDADKLFQNAGWCMDMLAMAAKDVEGMRTMTKALRRLAEFRVAKFGQAQLDAIMDPDAAQIGREWTPELARELGEPAVLVIGDEADRYIDSGHWKWLAARGRSLGIFLLLATPRSSTAEVPALIRGSVSTWKTFAMGDNYSEGFTLSQEAKDAGADPGKFRAPGLHYLDRAPGVDPRMYATPAREFESDPAQLRREVLRSRQAHPPMSLSPESVAYMGELFDKCRPDAVMGVRAPNLADDEQEGFDAEETQPVPPGPVSLGVDRRPGEEENGDVHEEEEGEPVKRSTTGTVIEDDQVAVLDTRSEFPGLDKDMAAVPPYDPDRPPPVPDPSLEFSATGKPRWSPEDTETELDRVLVEFAETGRMTFENENVMDAMRCEFSAVTCSRRLAALSDGARIAPPGITVERLGRGRFQIVRSRPQPGPRNR